MLLIGSMGATASLVYAAPAAPFSQPRSVVGGHMLSGAMGVTAFQVCAVCAVLQPGGCSLVLLAVLLLLAFI